LGKKAGVEITHVPYRGGGPAMNDVLGGHVDLIAGSAALITPQLEGKRIRPVMQLGRQRLAALPDTPTAIESGFPDFETLAWWGIFAPKGTPPDVIEVMEKSVRTILKEPALSANLRESQMMTLVLGGPKEFGVFFAKEVKFWGNVVRENNIKA
jgi:tripartite-type tricarboxylate transporter receptor subunit TctC